MKTVKVKPIAISTYFLFKGQRNKNNQKIKRNKNVMDANEDFNIQKLLIFLLKYRNYYRIDE